MSTSSAGGADTPSTVPNTSVTSNSGDGLTFDPVRLLSVFDEVALIVRGEDQIDSPDDDLNKQTVKQAEEDVPDFLAEDIPKNLDPLSLLLESVDQIEKLKAQLVPDQERDLELRDFIRAMNRKDIPERIDTCSYTLEALVNNLKTSLDNEVTLRDREAQLRKSQHNLRMQLAAERAKNQKMETDLENTQMKLEEARKEAGQLARKLEDLQMTHDDLMRKIDEEGHPLAAELRRSKAKNDKLKDFARECKEDLARLRDIEVRHDLLKDKLDEMLEDKIQVKKAEKLREEKMRVSL